MQTSRRSLLTTGALSLLSLYRNTLSHIMLPSCRFLPTCSAYAMESIQRRGLLYGGARALMRICRCHPFARGGVDPVA